MRSPGPACSRWTRRRLPAPWRSAIPRAPPPGRPCAGSAARPTHRPRLGPWRTRSMFKPSLARRRSSPCSSSVPSSTSRRISPPIDDPSPSLPGVVAPSSRRPARQRRPVRASRDSTGVWIATGSMGTPRSGHTAVRLLDGRVLVVGGANGDENDTSAELYDPASGTWSATGNMLKPRGGFPATLLRDGRVLVGDGDDPNADDEAAGTRRRGVRPGKRHLDRHREDGHARQRVQRPRCCATARCS